jgi:hypothetical protein
VPESKDLLGVVGRLRYNHSVCTVRSLDSFVARDDVILNLGSAAFEFEKTSLNSKSG